MDPTGHSALDIVKKISATNKKLAALRKDRAKCVIPPYVSNDVANRIKERAKNLDIMIHSTDIYRRTLYRELAEENKKKPARPIHTAKPKEESPQEEVTREDTGGFKYEEAAEKMYEYVNKQLSEEYPDNYIPGSIKIGSYFEKDASEFGAGAANVLKDVTFAVPFAALGAKAGAMYIGAHATGGAVATDLTVKAAGVIAGVAGGSITQRLLGLPDVLPGKTYQYNIMAEFKTGFAGGFNIYTVDIHESGRVIMEQARIG